MTGEMPKRCVDHKDLNKSNNKWENLREATYSQNSYNKKSTSKSGFKGVTFFKRDNNWKAQIDINGINKHLGYFKTPELAHEAYMKYATEIAGDFLRA
jgi:hypothetical protein